MSEFITVASDDGSTIGGSAVGNPAVGNPGSPFAPVTDDDPEGNDNTPVAAVLRGGPATGKQIMIDRIAGTFPLFIGVDGGNYVRDKGAHDRPVYNWWPAGASTPAGDPAARTDSR